MVRYVILSSVVLARSMFCGITRLAVAGFTRAAASTALSSTLTTCPQSFQLAGNLLSLAADGGTVVTLTGSNFGPCPTIVFNLGPAAAQQQFVTVSYCGAGCVCISNTPAGYTGTLVPAMTLVSTQTSLTFNAPAFIGVPGSADGSSLGFHYTMQIVAGGQAQLTPANPVQWVPPVIASVTIDGVTTLAPANASAAWSVDNRVIANADGTSNVTVTGTSFGACPSVVWASFATFSYCGSPCTCPLGVGRLSVATVGGSTVLRFVAPSGAGYSSARAISPSYLIAAPGDPAAIGGYPGFVLSSDAAVGATALPSSWYMVVRDGPGQASLPVPVGWSAPYVKNVMSVDGTFPTTGTAIRITGAMLGPGTAPWVTPVVYVGRGAFVDPVASRSTATPSPAVNCSGTCTPSASPTASAPASTWSECTGATVTTGSTGGPVTAITCMLPPGSGSGLFIAVIDGGVIGISSSSLLSYDRPNVTALASDFYNTSIAAVINTTSACRGFGAQAPLLLRVPAIASASGAGGVATELRGPTHGCFMLTISGSNFGPDLRASSPHSTCVFVASRARDLSKPLNCSGTESFPGEVCCATAVVTRCFRCQLNTSIARATHAIVPHCCNVHAG